MCDLRYGIYVPSCELQVLRHPFDAWAFGSQVEKDLKILPLLIQHSSNSGQACVLPIPFTP